MIVNLVAATVAVMSPVAAAVEVVVAVGRIGLKAWGLWLEAKVK